MRVANKIKKWIVLIFVVTFAVMYTIYMMIMASVIRDEKTRYQYLAINESNYIISCVDKVVVRTYMMREMIIEDEGNYDFFDKMAPKLFESILTDTGVELRNTAVAPGNIVTKVYPLKDNEAFVGFDYTDPSKLGNEEAIKAYTQGNTIITNPFELMQGGVGMSIRTPVYIEVDGEEQFWGMVSATMNFDNLLHAFRLDTLENMNLDYRLWYENDAGEKVVIADTGARMRSAISQTFDVYNLRWHLDIEPIEGWYSIGTDIFAKVIILLASLFLTLIFVLVMRIRDDGRRLKVIAEQDSLTHCYSRHYLNSVILNSDTANWRDTEHCFSLAIVDLDYFKSVNDVYGHSAGDMALVAVAQILQGMANHKKYDCVIRYGGDEFIICFNNVNKEQMEEKITSIVKQVREHNFEELPDLKLTVSVGAVVNSEENKLSFNDMIQLADANLYKVKEGGKNNFLITQD